MLVKEEKKKIIVRNTIEVHLWYVAQVGSLKSTGTLISKGERDLA
jgi:hypothetical protein